MPNQRINYRYRCKINEIHYDIQLYNIQQEKIKIMINTKNPYSEEYTEYSNIYSLIQFQEITRYYNLFENIEEIFEDLARTIQEKNFFITRNGNTLTFTIKIVVNKNKKDISFILEKNKIIDLASQKDYQIYSNTGSSYSDVNKIKSINQEKSKRNIDISSIGELNYLLSDLKDRITILETSQNNQFQNSEDPMGSKIMNNNNVGYSGNMLNNYSISAGLENILLRLNKLENENYFKDDKIEKLEKKLKYYESKEKNYNIQKDNFCLNCSVPNNSNNVTRVSIGPYSNYHLQTQALHSFTINKRRREMPYLNQNEIYIEDNRNKSYDYANLRNNRRQMLTNNNYHVINENNSFNSKYENRDNDNFRNSYIRHRTYRDNNKYYNDKDTNKSSMYLKSNSSISNYSNQYREKLAIPYVPRQDLKKYVNSRIIFTKAELRLLKTKLAAGDKHMHIFFDLLYRASVDGDYEEIIKDNTNEAEKTLTLFYTYEGSRFGVYIHKKRVTTFLKGKTFKEVPGTSFIVSLNNLRFFNIAPNQTSRNGHEDFLCFGRTFYLNKNGSNWLINTPKSSFLKKRCIIGDQKGDYINFDPEVLIGNKNDYHIKDIEIFQVAFERDDIDEVIDKKK